MVAFSYNIDNVTYRFAFCRLTAPSSANHKGLFTPATSYCRTNAICFMAFVHTNGVF